MTLHLKGNSGCKAKTYTTRSTCTRLSAGQLTRQPFHRHLSSDVVNMVSQNQQNGGHSFLQNWLEKSYKCQVCIDREPLACSLCCASFRTIAFNEARLWPMKWQTPSAQNKMADRGSAPLEVKCLLGREKCSPDYRALVIMPLVCSLHGASFVLIG